MDAAAGWGMLLEVLAALWPRLALHALHIRSRVLVIVQVLVRVFVRAGWRHQYAPCSVGESGWMWDNICHGICPKPIEKRREPFTQINPVAQWPKGS